MHKNWIRALIWGILLPGTVISAFYQGTKTKSAPVTEVTPVTADICQKTVWGNTESVGPDRSDSLTAVRVLQENGSSEDMPLDDYLTGVLLGELPPEFEEETKKALAVAARTLTVRQMEHGGKHPDADVCTCSSCCQAYCSPQQYLADGGSAKAVTAAKNAVRETDGQVLTYEGELIEALYFSCSGGSTEDAAEVWGAEVPYLQAVESPGEEKAAHFTDSVRFTREKLSELLGISLSGSPESWFSEARFTRGGGIAEMKVGNTVFSGTELRHLLNLRSTAFTPIPDKDGIIIVTRGFGHRVGMSQYGADAMALEGKNYREILAYYYPNTGICTLSFDKNKKLG